MVSCDEMFHHELEHTPSAIETFHQGPQRVALHAFLDLRSLLALAGSSSRLRAATSPETAPTIWQRDANWAVIHMSARGMPLLARLSIPQEILERALVAACTTELPKAQWLLAQLTVSRPSLAEECLCAAGCLLTLQWVLTTFGISRAQTLVIRRAAVAACRRGKWQLAAELTKRFSLHKDAGSAGYSMLASEYVRGAVASGDLATVDWAIRCHAGVVSYGPIISLALTQGYTAIAAAIIRRASPDALDHIDADTLLQRLCAGKSAPAAIICITHLEPGQSAVTEGFNIACEIGNTSIVVEILRTQPHVRKHVIDNWPQHLESACAHSHSETALALIANCITRVTWHGKKMHNSLAAACRGNMVDVLQAIKESEPRLTNMELTISGATFVRDNISCFDVVRWLHDAGSGVLMATIASDLRTAPDAVIKSLWLKKTPANMEWLADLDIVSIPATRMALVVAVATGNVPSAEWLINRFDHCRRFATDPKYLAAAKSHRHCDMVHLLRNTKPPAVSSAEHNSACGGGI